MSMRYFYQQVPHQSCNLLIRTYCYPQNWLHAQHVQTVVGKLGIYHNYKFKLVFDTISDYPVNIKRSLNELHFRCGRKSRIEELQYVDYNLQKSSLISKDMILRHYLKHATLSLLKKFSLICQVKMIYIRTHMKTVYFNLVSELKTLLIQEDTTRRHH